MAKKQKKQDTPGGANFMDTWADLVSLLMCFFVLLYAFSNIDQGKFEALSGSLINAFNGVGGAVPVVIPGVSMNDLAQGAIDDPFWPTPTSPDEKFGSIGDGEDAPGDGDGEGNGDGTGTGDVIFAEIITLIEEFLELRGIGGDVISDYATFSLVVRFNESILFDSGRADLRPEALEVLNAMTDIIVDLDELITMVRIEGHTDDVPLVSSRYVDNLELSGVRAANATRYIQESGRVKVNKIYFAGYGEYNPIASNETEAGRQMNRRVDFVIESLNLEAMELGGSSLRGN